MSHHKIIFENVSFHYPGGDEIIHDLSLEIGHGESIAILGNNGAGKSTLLRLMTGLSLPTKGKIYIGDILITKKTLPLIRQNIGFTFQDPDHQLFMGSVYEDIAFGPRNYGLDEIEVEKHVNKALTQVGCMHLKNRASHRLSGGEKRSIAIATVFAMDPSILIMDEPSTALDSVSRNHLIQLLDKFQHTKILATHDSDLVTHLCHRAVTLQEGKIIADIKL